MLLRTALQAKRFLKVIVGFCLLFAGFVMLFSPGPGSLTMALGLGLLAAEFVWARRLLENMRAQGLKLRDALTARAARHA